MDNRSLSRIAVAVKNVTASIIDGLTVHGATIVIGVCTVAIMPSVSSCSPCERLSRRCPPVESVRDSVYVHDTVVRTVYVHDTVQTVRLVPEYIYVTAPAGDTAYGETAYARAMAWLCGGNVSLRMWNKDSAAVLVKQIEVLEQRLREMSRVSERVEVKTERYVPWIVKVLAWAGGIALLYAVGKTVLRIAVRALQK